MCCINFPSLTRHIFHQKMKARALCSHAPSLIGALQFTGLCPKSWEFGDCDPCFPCDDVKLRLSKHEMVKKSSFFSSMRFVVIIPRGYPLEVRYPFGRYSGRIYNVSLCLVSYYGKWGFCGFVLSCLERQTTSVMTGHSRYDCIMGHEGISLLPNLDA